MESGLPEKKIGCPVKFKFQRNNTFWGCWDKYIQNIVWDIFKP